MTTSAIKSLTRVFRLGSITLNDPDPTLPPEQAVKLYSANYAIIDACTLSEPVLEGDQQVYTVVKPEVKTKG